MHRAAYEAEALPLYSSGLRDKVKLSAAPWTPESLAATQGTVTASSTTVPAFPAKIVRLLGELDAHVQALVNKGSATLSDGRTLLYDEARAQPFYFNDGSRAFLPRLLDVVNALNGEPYRQGA